MTELKCPFCGKELVQDNVKLLSCGNPECRESEHYFGTEKMWQELIRTRKALDVARNGLAYIFGYEGVPKYVAKHVRQVLDQSKIETALEQKDK